MWCPCLWNADRSDAVTNPRLQTVRPRAELHLAVPLAAPGTSPRHRRTCHAIDRFGCQVIYRSCNVRICSQVGATAQADGKLLGDLDWARIPTGQIEDALPFLWTENAPNVENPIVIRSTDKLSYIMVRSPPSRL